MRVLNTSLAEIVVKLCESALFMMQTVSPILLLNGAKIYRIELLIHI